MPRKFVIALLLLGVTGLGYTWLVYVPLQMLHGARYPVTKNPHEVGLGYRDIQLKSGVEQLGLQGWWMPADQADAVLVFLHGAGSNRHSEYFGSLAFYRSMVDLGISVLALDLRNHGASQGDGKGLGFGRSEAADARAALAWARANTGELPVFLMGISMGGATAIHAVADGAQVSGLILLDPLLNTWSTFTRGGWAETGLPPLFFLPSAWAGTAFYGLPGGAEQAGERAAQLHLPILLIQDPDDPVTLARYAQELAARNSSVQLWLAPAVDSEAPEHLWKGRWGSHVAAYAAYPERVAAVIRRFILEAP